MKTRLHAFWALLLARLTDACSGAAKEWYRIAGFLGKNWDKVGTVVLGVGGWTLLTDLGSRWAGGWVWELSAGLLALSLFGWRFAFTIARDGLYALSRKGTPK
jgi:hypothetical protein